MTNPPNLLYPNNDDKRKVKAKEKPGDGRSPYRRDWARLIHSPCFRRLQGKTQLFPSDEQDFYRNRLTHSLEVAQIASGIAENWNAKIGTFFEKNPINVDLVYFAGLAHDLGHPPFGHNGEKALDRLMASFGGFEGNAQTLRILARLEKKETEYYPSVSEEPQPIVNKQDVRCGLNVTYRSLAAVLKYDKQIPQAPEDRKADEKDKPVKGYYFTEADLVRDIKQNVLGLQRDDFKTIECGIMDVADDIAYSTYDLEDSMKAEFISPLKILAFEDEFKSKIVKEVNKQLLKTYDKKATGQELTVPEFDYIVATTFENVFSISNKVKSQLVAKYGNDKITEGMLSDLAVIASGQTASASASLCSTGYLRGEFTSKLVNDFINAVTIEVDPTYPQLSKVYLDIETFKKVEVLKTICFETIINSPRLKMAERRGTTIIKRIFRTLTDEKKGRRLLPEDWVDVYLGFKSNCAKERSVTLLLA
jgi:dGTPase